MLYPLGNYFYAGQEFELAYDAENVAKPLLVARSEQGEEKLLPTWESVQVYPARPISEAYKRAEAKGYRLYNLYKTQEVADILYAQGRMKKPRAQNIRNWLKNNAVDPRLRSGDLFISEEVFQQIIATYDEKINKRKLLEEKKAYRASHMTLNELAKDLGVSRETIRIYVKKGALTVEKNKLYPGLIFVSRLTAYDEIRKLPNWEVKEVDEV